MRFEAKHKYFKKMAQTLGNFTNIAKSLANRHQRYMCYKMTCSVQFLKVPDTYGPGLPKTNRNYTHQLYFYYFIHIGKRIVVNQLEYAANLLQMTDLCASSTVYRFEIIISKKFYS